MINTTLLLSAENFRLLTNVSDNIQDKFILPSLREAQEMGLMPILGRKLYDYIISLINEGHINDAENAVYKDLIDVCQYYLAYKALANIVVISSFKVDNIGANSTNDENVQSLAFNDVFRLKDEYVHKADFYCKRVQEFILEHFDAITILDKDDCCKYKGNLSSAASCQIWLGGKRGMNNNDNVK